MTRGRRRTTRTAAAGEAPGGDAADGAGPSKGERTRQALLDAAIERFGREGYRATSLTKIARDARLSSTAAYPYFANKEALFVEAVDEDAAGVIEDGLLRLLEAELGDLGWLDALLPSLLAAVDGHPLARRVLAGLEPEFTVRLLRIPALEQLRKLVADRILHHQQAGLARADIEPSDLAEGLVTIVISLMMSLVQTQADPSLFAGLQVRAVFEAALSAPPVPAPATRRRR